jgi:predicted DNA-binding transcriptional regulator YafY
MARGDQLERQWTLVHLLSGRLGRTLAQLQAELGVTKRTVQRDIAILERTGFPVVSEARNGTVFWHFIEGFRVEASVSLTLTEQMALYFSRGLLKPLQGTPLYESLESALQKIGSTLPPQGLHFLRGLDQAISVGTFGLKDYSRSKEIIAQLTRAISHKYTVRIEHRVPAYDEGIEREVDPYRFHYENNGLYLVAHDHRSGEPRLFAVERISWVKTTNHRFEIPADFDFETLKQTAFSMVWGEPQEVKIRFSPGQAPYIKERTWHPSQKIETERDGSILLTLRVAGLWEVKRWLIGFGGEARVLHPEDLGKEIEEECATLLRNRRPSVLKEAKV